MVARWTSTLPSCDGNPKAAGSSPARDAFLLFVYFLQMLGVREKGWDVQGVNVDHVLLNRSTGT